MQKINNFFIRALALKALDMRLSSKSPASTTESGTSSSSNNALNSRPTDSVLFDADENTPSDNLGEKNVDLKN